VGPHQCNLKKTEGWNKSKLRESRNKNRNPEDLFPEPYTRSISNIRNNFLILCCTPLGGGPFLIHTVNC
jgi:hypothetical protein